MSEPCEHEKDEAAWIWQHQLDMVKAERDAAQAQVDRVRSVALYIGERGYIEFAQKILDALASP